MKKVKGARLMCLFVVILEYKQMAIVHSIVAIAKRKSEDIIKYIQE